MPVVGVTGAKVTAVTVHDPRHLDVTWQAQYKGGKGGFWIYGPQVTLLAALEGRPPRRAPDVAEANAQTGAQTCPTIG